jgi:hypothetical protein
MNRPALREYAIPAGEPLHPPVKGLRDVPFLPAIIIFVGSAAAFISLRTTHYLAVDGALRALGVYYNPHPFVHGNNHLLYPIDVFVWTWLLHLLGISAANPFEFMSIAQAMNALAGAGCLAILYLLCSGITWDPLLSLCVVAGYGLSRAFLLHATNSAEPMVGLFWSFTAVGAASLSLILDKNWPSFAAGFLLLLAMATYQSMVLIGPAILILFSLWPSPRVDNRFTVCWPRIVVFLSGCASGLSVIYAVIYYRAGTHSILQMMARFSRLEGEHVYGGLRAANIANLPIGLLGNLLPLLPSDYAGLHTLLSHQGRPWLPVVLAGLLAIFAWLIYGTARIGKEWNVLNDRKRVVLLCCVATIAADILPLVFWDSLYDKLWLQPLAALFLASGVVLSVPVPRGGIFHLKAAGGAILTLVAVSNLVTAAYGHLSQTPYLQEAQQVHRIVHPGDLIVADWDAVSLLYGSFFSPGVNILSLPVVAGEDGVRTIKRVNNMVSATFRADAQVYFLGVLDTPEPVWTAFLGQRCGLPYDSFNDYRRCARAIEGFNYNGSQITLRKLQNIDECHR